MSCSKIVDDSFGRTAEEVEEYWTDSKRGLVVVADRPEVDRITRAVGLPSDAPVHVGARRWALALWGDAVPIYLRQTKRLLPKVIMAAETDRLVTELGPR